MQLLSHGDPVKYCRFVIKAMALALALNQVPCCDLERGVGGEGPGPGNEPGRGSYLFIHIYIYAYIRTYSCSLQNFFVVIGSCSTAGSCKEGTPNETPSEAHQSPKNFLKGRLRRNPRAFLQ